MADLLPPRSVTDLFGEPIDFRPLWFKKSSFLFDDFDPEAYIADLRIFVPLESLAAELRSHLATLKAELVEDYADFVSLSTRLVDDVAPSTPPSPLSKVASASALRRLLPGRYTSSPRFRN